MGSDGERLECRVVLRCGPHMFSLGMYDPVSGRYEALGNHPNRDKDRVVRDLKTSIERAGHLASFSEQVMR